MISKSKELLDRSLAAAISSIEIFNKPDFPYREESFSILIINAWELLLKAKWLAKHNNNIRCLHIYTHGKNKDGTPSKRLIAKKTRSNNHLTHNIEYVAGKLIESSELNEVAWRNIQALLEIRDSAIHFYNFKGPFSMRLSEVGAASLQNYTYTARSWFNIDFSKYNFYIIPVAFIQSSYYKAITLNQEEKNFIEYINSIDSGPSKDTPFAVSINIDIQFTRSKAIDAIPWRYSNSPSAIEVKLSEKQLNEKYPLSHDEVFKRCKGSIPAFKRGPLFYEILNSLKKDTKFCYLRELHPGNPKSAKKHFYSEAVISEISKQYLPFG